MSILPARLIVEALRLDQWSDDEVAVRVDQALDVGVGGFILFGGSVDRVGPLTERIHAAADAPMWVGADLERGAGQQIRGLTELPPPAALAVHPSPEEAARTAGRLTAEEALSVGINWVIAPVLDLDAEPDNPIVATRSFGSDPSVVATLGARWIEGCQSAGALACAKHFPGHGRTTDDSHIGLPIVDVPAEVLRDDLAPFGAVAGSVESVMVAHVAYPSLGTEDAATVSPGIVTGLLREQLGFEGPVSTDAMIMGGIGDDDASAAVLAVEAGVDLICYPRDVRRTAEALERACEREAFADRVATAQRCARAALGRSAAEGAGPEGQGGPEWAATFAAETIGPGVDLSAWDPRASTRVAAVSDDPQIGPPAGREGPLGAIMTAELEAAGWNVVGDAGASQTVVLLAATPKGWKGHGGPSNEVLAETHAQAGDGRALVVLFGHERWLDRLDVPGVCAWSTETVMERAAARWLDRKARGNG